MKIYLISDNNDTQTGFKFTGVDGCVVHTREALLKELNAAIADPDMGIVLIMERLAAAFPDIINNVKLNRRLPLIVEIPDRHGTGRNPDFIGEYIRDAIGIKL
jgi:V/A-type H+-transporting ATPase subunit F